MAKKTSSTGEPVQEEKEEAALDLSPMQQLITAMIKVMSEVEYLKKDDTISSGGNNSYKGITDEKVRESVRVSLIKHGLVIVPTKVHKDTTTERWEEESTYQGKTQVKRKSQVFSEVTVCYTIYHVSGAFMTAESFGHGVDNMDKAPGKGMTYAYKYLLLTLFCIPTGDDPDKIHSDAYETPPKEKRQSTEPAELTLDYIRKKVSNTLVFSKLDNTKQEEALASWLSKSGEIYYGCYVKIYSNTKQADVWFQLSDNEVSVFKAYKEKHNA